MKPLYFFFFTFLVFSFSDLIINVFFGRSYIPAANAIKILSIGMIFATISGIGANFFSGIGKPQITSKIVYSAATFNFIANLILIPILGIIGAAITTSLSYFIMMSISLINIRKFITIKFPIKVWTRTSISGILFVLIIVVLKKVIILNVWLETSIVLIIAGIFYVGLLFLFKVINFNELKSLYKRIV